MKSRQGTRMLLIIGALFLLCIGYISVRVIFNAYIEHSKTELESAAEKLGVDASLEGILGYVEKAIKPGMSREEVLEILREVAPVVEVDHLPRYENADCIILGFSPSSNTPNLLILLAEYDSDDKLTAIGEW